MKRIAVSACLAGIACRYNGQACPHPLILALMDEGLIVPLCPEVLGGLPVPRSACECRHSPHQVNVVGSDGGDYTVAFKQGAELALQRLRATGCYGAILKERSPSCGVHCIYDGSFSGRRIPGQGIFTQRLLAEYIPVLSSEDIPDVELDLESAKARLDALFIIAENFFNHQGSL